MRPNDSAVTRGLSLGELCPASANDDSTAASGCQGTRDGAARRAATPPLAPERPLTVSDWRGSRHCL
jgi:hypothetical protein